MKTIIIHSDFITLGQMLKFSGIIRNGGEAKSFLAAHEIKVNGEFDNRRGRKLRDGDQVNIDNKVFVIKNDVCPS